MQRGTQRGALGFVGALAGMGVGVGGCSGAGIGQSPSSSEVAVSVVSGALNNSAGSQLAMLPPAAPRRSPAERVIDSLRPEGTAWAATWTCSGGALSPAFAGPGDYAYTPWSCSVTWDGGRTASARWDGVFDLTYGPACDATHPFVVNQAAGCGVTRTTASGGNTRTITGPDGNSYAIRHDTNGAGSGWDSSVSPAPDDGGVVVTPSSILVHGSHLVGTVDIGHRTTTIWDHTVSTAAGPMTVAATATGRVVDGSVTVQHNLAHETAVTTFTGVTYDRPACCFPSGGTVSTSFTAGSLAGKTETLAFGALCGDATLTRTDGSTESIVLAHCL
jgi:hypothetical protein